MTAAADLTWLDVGHAVLAVTAFVSVLLVATGWMENRRDVRAGLHPPYYRPFRFRRWR